MGKAALGFAGLMARVPKANAGHDSLRPRPQGHALSRLTRVTVTTRGLRAHGWSRRLGDDSISLWQKMKELIGMPTRTAWSLTEHCDQTYLTQIILVTFQPRAGKAEVEKG